MFVYKMLTRGMVVVRAGRGGVMSRIFVVLMGLVVGYVAYNFGSRIRQSMAGDDAAIDTSDGDGDEPYVPPMSLADSIRQKVAEAKAQKAQEESEASGSSES